MVSSPIGGFMPIPLAMMPAFMAYQSMLMGDSFGQAYQYGKRKISAMTNEDFNKLSISKLFDQATIEYDKMIPSLKTSMKNSQDLQGFIVKELLAIIPNLITDAFGGTDEEKDITDSPFLKTTTQLGSAAAPLFIRYTTDRETTFNEEAIQTFKEQIDPLLEQAGTKQDLIDKQNETIPPPKDEFVPEDVSHLTSDDAWLKWNEELTQLKLTISVARTQATKQSQTERGWTERSDRVKKTIIQDKLNRNNAYKNARSALLRASRDYRNPNNNIRNYVLKLRRELAAGKWK